MFLKQLNRMLFFFNFRNNKLFQSQRNYVSAKNIIDTWKLRFEKENVPEIDASIRYILGHVLQKRKFDQESLTLNKNQITQFDEMCELKIARVPIQYILGNIKFRDLILKMTPPVFIPRPETEELVELILQQADINRNIKFLEIGCGSGAISLALLIALPQAKCTAIDQSKSAVMLTQKNAMSLNLQYRINVLEEKVNFENQLNDLKDGFDFIVSNPPYVKTGDLHNLEPEIKLYEDLRALDGGGDGMKVIKPILHLASKKLKVTGNLWLEVDSSQPEMIATYIEMNQDKLQLKFVASYKDLFKKDRFVEIIKI